MNAISKKPIFVIFLTVFIDLVGFGIIIPLSPYLARNFGATPAQVGLLMAIYSLMQFIFSPLWGGLSDRVGRRPILLMSILGTAMSHFMFYVADALWVLFLARALAGIFGANISTAMAYIADITSEQNRSKNMGLIGAAFGLGFILGPAIGGLTTSFGERVPLLVAAAISGFNFFLAVLILKESLKPELRRVRIRKSRFVTIFDKLKKPVVGVLLFAQFACAMAMANMESVMFLFVKDQFNWSVQLASFAFAYVGICIAFTQGFLIRRLLPKYGERPLLIVGFIFFSGAMYLIGAVESISVLALAMTLLAIGNGFITPAVSGSLSLLTPATEQGEIIGVNHSIAALARIIGPYVGGLLYMHLSHKAPFLLAGILGTIGFIFIWLVRRKIPLAAKIITH